MEEATETPDAGKEIILPPSADYESDSPQKDFYAEWNTLSRLPVDSPKQTFAAVKLLATLSRTKYFNAPVAAPDNIRDALVAAMTSKPDSLNAAELEFRRRTLRQLKYHFENQTAKAKTLNPVVADKWNSALTALKAVVARQGRGKMFLTVYKKDDTNRIFNLADAASAELWDEIQLKIVSCPTYNVDRQAGSIDAQLSKHPDWSEVQKAAFIATRKCSSIVISKDAKSIGILSCDQEHGVIKTRERIYQIPKTSYLVWTAIRLLISSPDCHAVLWPKWDSVWGKDDDKLAFKRDWICPETGVRRLNGLRFCLKRKKNISA